MNEIDPSLPVVLVPLAQLRPHPRNYRAHPDDQLEHIKASLQQHGFYRNVVIARDNTILAGHGVVLGAKALGYTDVPCIRLDLDPDSSLALKVLTGDNEISHLGEVDDRALSELLKEIGDVDLNGLLGTGYDVRMLSALVFVTRPESEVQTPNEAAHWVGMPDYEEGEAVRKVIVNFRTEADRVAFVEQSGLSIAKRETQMWTTWWPAAERDDAGSLRFEG